MQVGDNLPYLNVLSAVDEFSVLLGQPDGSILQWSEDGGGDVDVVCVRVGVGGEPLGQQLPRLDGHRGQLLLATHHVTDGVDVGDIGLLIHCRDLATVGRGRGER